MNEVERSPLVKKVKVGDLQEVSGRFGDYTVTFASPDQGENLVIKAGAIIASLAWEIIHRLPEWGHDGERVICQIEMNDLLRQGAHVKGPVIFWVNDLVAGQPYGAQLSLKTAWHMAEYLKETSPASQVVILYDSDITIPVGVIDRVQARRLEIALIPYEGSGASHYQAGQHCLRESR